MILVVEKYESFDTPMIVDEIWVIKVEILTPSFALGRKAAKEQNLASVGQERNEGMVFNVVRGALNVGRV